MSDSDKILVRYVRNADDGAGTGAIQFNEDDRDDLKIGELGYVSQSELYKLTGFGITLEPITPKEAKELNLVVPEEEAKEVPLAERSEADLKQIAEDEGVDLTGKRSNAAKADAIEQARVARLQPEGVSSLPATATTGPATPVAAPPSVASTSTSGGAAS